ncbi:hypothetical protein Efla_002575 [Eimeria flavescens]
MRRGEEEGKGEKKANKEKKESKKKNKKNEMKEKKKEKEKEKETAAGCRRPLQQANTTQLSLPSDTKRKEKEEELLPPLLLIVPSGSGSWFVFACWRGRFLFVFDWKEEEKREAAGEQQTHKRLELGECLDMITPQLKFSENQLSQLVVDVHPLFRRGAPRGAPLLPCHRSQELLHALCYRCLHLLLLLQSRAPEERRKMDFEVGEASSPSRGKEGEEV